MLERGVSLTQVMVKKEFRNALVICTRRLGDVLLATPVVRSLKAAWPHLMVDMLVFEGTQEILSANEDLRRIWTIPEHPPVGTHLTVLRSIWRRYDLALSVLAGDRPTFHAWVAGKYRIGTLLPDNKSWWKRKMLHEWVPFDNLQTHTVMMNLQLLAPFEINPLGTPVVSGPVQTKRLCLACFLICGIPGDMPYCMSHPSLRIKHGRCLDG